MQLVVSTCSRPPPTHPGHVTSKPLFLTPCPTLTCLPSTSAVTSPLPPAPLAVLPTRLMYSEGSLGKSNSTTCSTNEESTPREALKGRERAESYSVANK